MSFVKKLCRALPEASHLTCLWPGIIYHHHALLPQELDCCPPAFSGGYGKKAVHRALGRCFVSSLPLHHRGFSPVHPSHAGIQCKCCQFQVVDLLVFSSLNFCPCGRELPLTRWLLRSPHSFQRYCDAADCDPDFSVDGSNHNLPPTPAIFLFATIPVTTYCFPFLWILYSFNCDL